MSITVYLTLAQAGMYCGGRFARWARRHLLPYVPHIHPPGSGILFRTEDVDRWLAQYREEPICVDDVVAIFRGVDAGGRETR